jgi:Ca2+-binding RTX toxin-like protein
MLELIILTSVLGLGLAIDYIASGDDESEPDAVEVALAQDALRFDGTDAREHVTGNALDNIFLGGDEDDLLGGLAGDDMLFGENGDDRLFGGAGDDTAIGGAGNDRIFLGDGNDTTAQSLPDAGDAGDDFIRGGAGADSIIDTRGSNQIFGDTGNDRIITVDGLADNSEAGTADTVDGGFGNDTLFGDAEDVLTGGAGEDRFVIALPSTLPGAPAVITDFDLRDDLFSVVFMETAPANETVTFAFDSATKLVHAQVNGQEVATLEGLTAADVPFINTFVTTLPELMAA